MGEKKNRACLGYAAACAKQVFGHRGDRLCNACKNLNIRRQASYDSSSESDALKRASKAKDIEFWRGLK